MAAPELLKATPSHRAQRQLTGVGERAASEDGPTVRLLALLYLTMFRDSYGTRAWKSHDWEALDRLHAKGYISDPKSKAKSVVMTEEGARRARELFEKHFATKGTAQR
jgi:hypothetical protein